MDVMVVDPNIAFATLLEQELVRLGYRVVMCTSGAEALALSRREMPELTLLDMALEAPGALALGRQLRALEPGVRLMLIPMMGDEPILDDDAPAIQGVLTKPFFLPELPNAIQAALDAPLFGSGLTSAALPQSPTDLLSGLQSGADTEGVADAALDEIFAEDMAKEAGDPGALDWLVGLDDAGAATPVTHTGVDAEMSPEASPPAEVAERRVAWAVPDVTAAVDHDHLPAGEIGSKTGISRRAFRMNQGRIEALMRELVADIGADGVLLTSEDGLLTAVGNLDEAEIESIAAAVLYGVQTSAEVARILGREQLRFEQSIAGGSYILYALSVLDAVLAVTVSGDSALGLLRLRARAAAEQISALCVAA